MKKKIIATLITLLLPTAAYSAETPVIKTPKEVIGAAKAKGPKRVVAELWTSRAWERYVYPGIASGEKQWLDVAVILKPGTDAGASEELNDALSLALLKQPDLGEARGT